MPSAAPRTYVHPSAARLSTQLLAVIEAFRSQGAEVGGGPADFLTRCPNHDDRSASLSFGDGTRGVRFKCHAGCDQHEMFASVCTFLGMQSREFFYRSSARPTGPVPTLAELAERKHLPVCAFQEVGATDSPEGILFPYGNGRARLRRALAGHDRFRWRGEGPIPAYGAWNVERFRPGGTIFLVEGETDTLTGLHLGLPVLGIPGKNFGRAVFREHPDLVSYIQEICVIEETDDYERRSFLGGVRQGLSDARWDGELLPVRLPAKDLSELFIQRGRDGAIEALAEAHAAAADAPSWPDPGSVPLEATHIASVIRSRDFPGTYSVQQIRNRLRDLTSEQIIRALTLLEGVRIVRRLSPEKRPGRPAVLYRTNPKARE
jgi:hypothetical protein